MVISKVLLAGSFVDIKKKYAVAKNQAVFVFGTRTETGYKRISGVFDYYESDNASAITVGKKLLMFGCDELKNVLWNYYYILASEKLLPVVLKDTTPFKKYSHEVQKGADHVVFGELTFSRTVSGDFLHKSSRGMVAFTKELGRKKLPIYKITRSALFEAEGLNPDAKAIAEWNEQKGDLEEDKEKNGPLDQDNGCHEIEYVV